jgi:hypothetical protein
MASACCSRHVEAFSRKLDMGDITANGLTLNAEAQTLFEHSGELAAFAELYVFREVLKETFGPSSIATDHFTAGQSQWPALSPKWLKDARKRGSSGKFFQTGRTLRAINRKPSDGEFLKFGASGAVKKDRFQMRYVTGAVWVHVSITKNSGIFQAGFNGELKHSKAFNQARTAEAKANGLRKFKRGEGAGRQMELRRLASVDAAHSRLKAGLTGKGPLIVRKFAAVGSKGVGVLARGADNLAYANLLQRGVHKGIKTAGGSVVSPRRSADLRLAGKGPEGSVVTGKAMPLLPYTEADFPRLQRAIERGLLMALREERLLGFAEAA